MQPMVGTVCLNSAKRAARASTSPPARVPRDGQWASKREAKAFKDKERRAGSFRRQKS